MAAKVKNNSIYKKKGEWKIHSPFVILLFTFYLIEIFVVVRILSSVVIRTA